MNPDVNPAIIQDQSGQPYEDLERNMLYNHGSRNTVEKQSTTSFLDTAT